MKRSKRFLSAVLVICMVLSMLPSLGMTASAAAGDTYELVTDASTLQAGDMVIIVAAGYDYALSTTQNENNRGQAAVTKASDNTLTFSSNVQELTLEAGTITNTFAFYTGAGYLYAASSSSNHLKTQTTLNDNGSWTITIGNEGVATIQAQGTNKNNQLQYNLSSKLFSCYGSAQKEICIYKKTSSATTTTSTLSYSENGTITKTDRYTTGESVTLPTTATAVSGYTFMGWSETEITPPVDTAPASLLTGSYTMPATDTTLYAVYAKATVDSTPFKISLTYDNDGTSTTYWVGSPSGTVLSAVTEEASAAQFSLVATANGTYYLYDETDKKYIGWSTKTTLLFSENASTETENRWEWTYDASAGTLKIGERFLAFNINTSGTPRFSTYNDSTTYPHTLVFSTSSYVTYTGYTTAPDAGTTPSTDVKMTVNIRCGEGTAYVTRNGETIATTSQANNASSAYVSQGDVLTVVMKPATGYHAVTLERDSARINSDDWTAVDESGTYSAQYTVSTSSVYFNVTFLPKRLNTGVVAEQVSTLEAGLYVITGVPSTQNTAPESTDSNNAHDAANTYLLYGNDGLTGDVIGRKSAALKLSDIGVTLDSTSPYQMANLNDACLFEFAAGEGDYSAYYTIRMCGATTDQYLTCTGNNTENFIAQGTLSDNAYWSVTVDKNGVAKIQSKAYPGRYLKFLDGGHYQFRTYATDTDNSTWPVLYKASQTGYLVSYSKTGGGAVTAYNVTKGNNVASGSVQAKDSQIRFTFTPSEGYELKSASLNGKDILSQISYNTYTVNELDQSVDVVATFEKIVYNNAITVKYYVNNTLEETVELTVPDKYYNVDLSRSVTVNGTSRTYADLTFSKAVNGDAEYTSVSDPILISDGNTINLYFLTTAVNLEKTAKETTTPDASLTGKPNGGTSNGGIGAFSGTENNKDEHGNVKQTFEVNLHVESSDMIPGYTTAKPTDIILVLDDSNSMFPDTTDGRTINNAQITKQAINTFLDVALNGDNRVAVVQYNSYASAWDGSEFVQYAGSNATYSTLTEARCFMSDRTKINVAVSAALTQDEDNGATNTMGGFMMAQIVAETRSVNTERNLIVLLFTDGEPTVRYAQSTSSGTKVYYNTIETDRYTTGTKDYSGARTSDIEYDRALYRGQQLRSAIDKFTKAKNYIYSVALLGGEDYGETDRLLVEYLMSTSPKGFTFGSSHIEDLREYVYTTDRWFNAAAYSNAYFPVTSNDATTVTNEMVDIFKQIAYTTVADSYITGSLTDTIPAEFKLTDASKTKLEEAGWTVTENADHTTTITKDNVVANETGSDLTYEIEYQGGGVGSVFTNTSASFTYTDILTGTETTGNFAKPAVSVVAWTKDDEVSADIGVDRSIDVTYNDLFGWLTEGGYTFTSYKIRLTDKDGNDKTYYDAVNPQTDDEFDAYVDENSQTVSFYTLTPGLHTFYYVVEATVRAPDGTETTVYSRATKVDVTVTDLPTVNDADVVKANEEKTINVLWNDTLDDGEGVTTTVTLTDKDGNVIDAAAVGLTELKVNEDGTITYKTPESEEGIGSVYEFYYVVKQTSGELTLASQPTKVTVYSVESQYLVVDFGLTTLEKDYRLSSNAFIVDDITLDSELTVSGLALRIGENEYGTMTSDGSVFTFKPSTTNFNGVSVYEYSVKMPVNAYNQSADNVTGTVTVIPANNVYYEENFVTWNDDWMDEGERDATIEQDIDNLLRHGYEPGYEKLEDYSNGNEKSVTVTKEKYESNGYFTFTGTGFDLYGECGPNSGVIVAEVYEGEITGSSKPVKVILMDTYLANKTYYQIPVIMCRLANHGTYTVKLRAFYNEIFDHNYPAKTAVSDARVRALLGLDAETELTCLDMHSVDLSGAKTGTAPKAVYGQYNVYVDAVRIYNPLGTLTKESGIAYTAYHAANEENPVFVNINDTVIDAANTTGWANATAGVEGILYLATGGESANAQDVFDEQTLVCLGAAGTINTETANGKDYVLGKDGKRIQYEGADVYVADYYDLEHPEVLVGKAFYYDKDGSPVQLNRGQLSTLNIYCYENKYDAIGPENEVYLKNGQGLAFKVRENAHIQISAKIPFGTSAILMAYTDHAVAGVNEEAAAVGWHTVEVVKSRTELYYDLTQYVNSDQTLILKCVTDEDANTVLSLCNFKGVDTAAGTTGAEPLMTVDAYTLAAAMDAFYPKAHTHTYTDTVTAPTCTERGYTTHTCECSETFVDSYVDALGHDWDDGAVTLAPTETEAGVKTYSCSRCSETYTETLAPLGDKPCDGGEDCPSAAFTDVSAKDWYHLSVDFVAEHELMGGIGDGKFDPEGTMNRAMLVTVLWRCAGKPTGAKNPFTDVPAGEWYTDAVAWAAENGIVNGVGDGKFDPLGNVTREQIAVILCRYTEVCDITDTSKRGDLRGYPDVKQVSDYAADALAWAVGEGLILGSEGKLLPQGDATRAQVATILMRYLQMIEE